MESPQTKLTFAATKYDINDDEKFLAPADYDLSEYSLPTSKSKVSELEMQNYIWIKRKTFNSLIVLSDSDSNLPIENKFNLQYLLWKNAQRRIKHSYLVLHDSETELIGKEVPLPTNDDLRKNIRLDLLGVSKSNETSICLIYIELKKVGSNNTREALTELLAYSSYFSNNFIGSSNNHYMMVLISPIDPTILEYSVLQQMLFEKKNFLVLEPYMKNDDLETLKLKIWAPKLATIERFTNQTHIFGQESFTVLFSTFRTKHKDDEKLEKEIIVDIINDAAQQMESLGMHGFVWYYFKSSTWEHPHFLIQAQLDPFNLSKKNDSNNPALQPNDSNNPALQSNDSNNPALQAHKWNKADLLSTYLNFPQKSTKCEWDEDADKYLDFKNTFRYKNDYFPFGRAQLLRYTEVIEFDRSTKTLVDIFKDDIDCLRKPEAFRFTGLILEMFHEYLDLLIEYNQHDGSSEESLYLKSRNVRNFCRFLEIFE
ncbi:unnamed protein product [Adineta steineri]|uniref:Uncharacterized protein n=1 Tax=Adineta steineri TaxID=433720 RepID=A0A813QI44_9BILA|nr:unnamed protein product [Adineta steineri]CAF0768267.1 unnamed protein product [Adineta steineri]